MTIFTTTLDVSCCDLEFYFKYFKQVTLISSNINTSSTLKHTNQLAYSELLLCSNSTASLSQHNQIHKNDQFSKPG